MTARAHPWSHMHTRKGSTLVLVQFGLRFFGWGVIEVLNCVMVLVDLHE